MRISFLGAARTVTGSQHHIQINGHSLLLDCGLYQGNRAEAEKRNREFAFDPASLDAVVLSHAHIDHSGNLPNLVKSGYSGPIYCTPVTAHLSDLMLQDSGHIQEYDAMYVNRKREARGEPRVQPLYTQDDAARVKDQFRSVRYDRSQEILPGVTLKLVEAGHILGSAAVVLDIQEKGGGSQRIWFSGDIGRLKLPLVRDPILPSDANQVIMECTYGDTSHEEPEEGYQELQQILSRTLKRGGKVIIPAFAVGRTQDLVFSINQMMANGDLPRVPVYVDSPLAVAASDIFRDHPDYFDEETQQFMREEKNRSALGFDLLTYTRSVEESKALNEKKEPMIIISASGMVESGRILHHLAHNIENAYNTVLIVSWQAPNTLGRYLKEGARQIKIFGDPYEVRAEVKYVRGFSAHAGQSFLLEYALATKESAKQYFLVHGEDDAAEALRQKMNESGLKHVHYPYLKQSMEI